ncbi:type VI secretion system-associated protein TagO [Bradyrhizobium cytisi]|nr:type VI secretion system-associated protein TagO [Bradyrhizobium cytisi]
MRFQRGPARRHPGLASRNNEWMLDMKIVRIRTPMTTLVLISALGLFARAALAAEPSCRAIESTSERLACYDAAFPPKAKKPAMANIDAPSGYKDPFVEEEARTAAKLKNICRGC